MGLWRRLYGTGHEASGQGHYGSGKLQRTQPAGDQRGREPQGDPDLVRVDRLRSHACQYLPQRWAETRDAATGSCRQRVEGRFRGRHPEFRNGVEKIGEMSLMFSPDDLRVMTELRHVFDPLERSNPGKVIPQPGACVEVATPRRQVPI